MQDPYTLLGVAKTANAAEIKSAYRKLAKKLHPDVNPGRKDIEQKFKEVTAAYDLLSDADKRARFDRGEIDSQGQERGYSGGGYGGYGGAGYILNRAPGMRDHTFAGWQAQRELNKKLTLGAEWFNPGRESMSARNTHLLNAGGIYNFNENFSFLFTAGHSIRGDTHTVAYFGLYWTWGKRAPGDEPKLASSLHSAFGRATPFRIR